MQAIEVKEINVSVPLSAMGKVFIGDYSKTQQYVLDIHKLLNKKSISFVPNKVMGVYYDNPQEKKPETLRSFQGVFLNNPSQEADCSLTKLSLQGNYLYTQVSGDPVNSIFEGYGAMFKYIEQHKVKLKSNTGYQISTFENGLITTEIYMELE